MRFGLLLLACFSISAIAAPCQVKLSLSSDQISINQEQALSADQTLARESFSHSIENLLEGIRSAGLELVEESEAILAVDLATVRDGEKIVGTRAKVKINMENKLGSDFKIEFERASSLPFLARVGLTNRSKAQVKELDKRLLEITREISDLPGCR